MHIIRVFILLTLLVFSLISQGFARPNPDRPDTSIVINLPSRTLELYSNSSLIKVYPIAVGKPSTPSPLGNFQIYDKEIDPWWYPPRTKDVIPSGPGNPLGYRWMEFAPTYGVHGTNAPWSIGQAVSNGCIRMQEGDVEELFEIVSYGTSVRISYDRVKVLRNAWGEVSIGIYPDIYGWQDVSLDEVHKKLALSGVDNLLGDDALTGLINEQAGQQIVFARFNNIQVNGITLAENSITYKDTMYIPVRTVAGILNNAIAWDCRRELIHGDQKAVPGVMVGDRLFATAENIGKLFDVKQIWNAKDNCLLLEVLKTRVNKLQDKNELLGIDRIFTVGFELMIDSRDTCGLIVLI